MSLITSCNVNPHTIITQNNIISPTLISFDILLYVYFSLVIALSYPFYYLTTVWLKWENASKPFAFHFSDLLQSLTYGYIVFTLGDYSNTLNWVTLVSYVGGLWGFGVLAELSFLKVSLDTYRSWGWATWTFMTVVALLILAAIGFHLYLAAMANIWLIYLLLFCLAWTIPLLAALTVWCFNKWYGGVKSLKLLENGLGLEMVINAEEADFSPPPPSAPPSSVPVLAGKTTYKWHLHHWQLFFLLAFFTRFYHWVSQLCAGLTLAFFMQGGIAYGFDPILIIVKS